MSTQTPRRTASPAPPRAGRLPAAPETAARPPAHRVLARRVLARRVLARRVLARLFPRALGPALVYMGGQACTLLVVMLVALARHRFSPHMLWSWDGEHFLAIARSGYTPSVAAHVNASPAFFPGYPAALATVAALTGLSLPAAALMVSWVSGIAFAYGLTRLVEHVVGPARRVALLAVALAGGGPLAIVLQMAYSEALFCALAVWCLVALVEHRWLTAGLSCAAAGTVRQTGIALVLAVLVAVGIAAAQRITGWRTWIAALLAPAGLVGYLAYVAVSTGRLTGWLQAERNGWGSRFDFGRATGIFTYRALVDAMAVLDVATVAVMGIALIALVAAAISRMPLPLLAYSVAVIVVDLLSNGIMNSKIRLLVPAFTLLIPIAQWLRAQSRGAMVAVTGCVLLAGVWYSAYALVIYGYAI